MTNKVNCESIQELFPMLFNGNLDQADRDSTESHLGECQICRRAYQEELAMFEAAEMQSPIDPKRHPSGKALDQLASKSSGLSPEEAGPLKEHLIECQVCRDAVDKLKQLPDQMESLVDPHQIPLIEELNLSGTQQAVPKKSLAERVMEFLEDLIPAPAPVIRAAAGVAAIAIIAISVITFQADDSLHQARLSFLNDGNFPSVPVQTRAGAAVPTVIESEGSVELSIYVEPIFSSNNYKLELRGAKDDLILSVPVTKDIYIPGIGFSLRLTTTDLALGRYFISVVGTDRSDGSNVSINIFPFDLER